MIEITSKRGASEYVGAPATNVNTLAISGFSAQREFYAPLYDSESNNPKNADLRSTIYWDPNIVTNPEGKAQVSYYTADQPGTYRVVVEGINIDGKLLRKVYTYPVK